VWPGEEKIRTFPKKEETFPIWATTQGETESKVAIWSNGESISKILPNGREVTKSHRRRASTITRTKTG